MILEVAHIDVREDAVKEFVAAVSSDGLAVLEQAEGFLGLEVHPGIERPNVVMLLLRWTHLEAHTEGFRGGDLFPQWRAVISPFFTSAPVVEHWTVL